MICSIRALGKEEISNRFRGLIKLCYPDCNFSYKDILDYRDMELNSDENGLKGYNLF